MTPQTAAPRILLTGKTGQVGKELIPYLEAMGELTAVDRQQLDLAEPEEIRQCIRSLRPEIIVNAAAYTAVDRAESEHAAAQAINATAPGILAEEAKRAGSLLVHYSTDYVFDGTKGSPYEESDTTNPLSVYGRTKLEGERAICQLAPCHLIFRTAWVYAAEGRNFLLTILRLVTEKKELRIVRDQIGAPTWSREIAAATVKVLSQLCSRANNWSEISGIYHMTAGGETNWYEFADVILQHVQRQSQVADWVYAATHNRPITVRRIIPIRTDEYPTPARRPPYSVLSNRRLNEKFGVFLSDWRAQLHALFSNGPRFIAPQQDKNESVK